MPTFWLLSLHAQHVSELQGEQFVWNDDASTEQIPKQSTVKTQMDEESQWKTALCAHLQSANGQMLM